MDADTYEVGVSRIGIADKLDTLVISAAGTDTITVVAYTPPSAPGSDSVCVEGWIFSQGYTYPLPGAKAVFYVTGATLKDTATGVILEKLTTGIEAPVNDTGGFRIYVPASCNLVPWKDYLDGHWTSSDTVFYNMEVKRGKATIWGPIENIFIPDTTGCLNFDDAPFR